MMHWKDEPFAPRIMVARRNIPRAPTLLQELLYHAKGDAEASRDLVAGPLLIVVRSQDSFAQI